MKQCKRWLAVLLVVALCLPLCGCQMLEDMRAAHAVWQEDGSILWNGNVYRLLRNVSEKSLVLLEDGNVWVTEADVPVLLSETLGDYGRVSHSGALILTYDHDGETLYCREDRYDFMAEYLKDPKLTTYYYAYWDYDSAEQCYYYLSEQQGHILDQLVKSLEFVETYKEFYSDFEDNDFGVWLDKCDDERIVGDDEVLKIVRKGGVFYLVTPDEYIAEVPKEYDDTMKAMVSVYFNEEISPYI